MSSELDAVNGLLTAARRKLSGLEQEADMVRAEIRAYERVVLVLTGSDPSVADSGNGDAERFASRRKRELSATWKKILAWIGRQLSAPDTEAVWRYILAEQLDVQRNNLRSQLSSYTARGLLRRESGRYTLTDQGEGAVNGNVTPLGSRSGPTLIDERPESKTADPPMESAA